MIGKYYLKRVGGYDPEPKLDWCTCFRCRPILVGAVLMLGYSEAKVKDDWEHGKLFAWYCPEHDPTMKDKANAKEIH